MKDVVIVEAYRTAIGGLGRSLVNETAEKLITPVFKKIIKESQINASEIDEVILGQAKQTADLSNVARVAALNSDIPFEVPAYTVHRQCGSGLQSIVNAAMQIQTDNADIVLCGGTESMSTAPYYVNDVRFGAKAGNILLKDPNTASQTGSQPFKDYGEITMGLTADNIAEKYQFSRELQDKFAFQSQVRAKNAIEMGYFDNEIVPYEIVGRKGTVIFDKDEHPRETSLEKLAKLKPVFSKEGTGTAGNASGRNDGAAAVLVMSLDVAKSKGYKKGLKVVSTGLAGVDPLYMGLGPIPASKKALEKAGLNIEDIDIIELNEAFAAQSLAFYKEFNLDIEDKRINPNGGAIALGHPIGATGAILTTKLFHDMQRKNAKYGMVTLCIAGGLGIATIFELVNID